jgi:hypothetical protein
MNQVKYCVYLESDFIYFSNVDDIFSLNNDADFITYGSYLDPNCNTGHYCQKTSNGNSENYVFTTNLPCIIGSQTPIANGIPICQIDYNGNYNNYFECDDANYLVKAMRYNLNPVKFIGFFPNPIYADENNYDTCIYFYNNSYAKQGFAVMSKDESFPSFLTPTPYTKICGYNDYPNIYNQTFEDINTISNTYISDTIFLNNYHSNLSLEVDLSKTITLVDTTTINVDLTEDSTLSRTIGTSHSFDISATLNSGEDYGVESINVGLSLESDNTWSSERTYSNSISTHKGNSNSHSSMSTSESTIKVVIPPWSNYFLHIYRTKITKNGNMNVNINNNILTTRYAIIQDKFYSYAASFSSYNSAMN